MPREHGYREFIYCILGGFKHSGYGGREEEDRGAVMGGRGLPPLEKEHGQRENRRENGDQLASAERGKLGVVRACLLKAQGTQVTGQAM